MNVPGRTYTIDITRLLEDKATFYSLTVAAPPRERSVLNEAKLLGISLPEKAKKVIKDGSRFVSLPKDETKVFEEVRGRARRTFQSYAIYFPFLPPGVVAVPKEREVEMRADLNKMYNEFEAAKEVLLDKLDGIRAARRAEFQAAGEAVFAERAPTYPDGTAISKEEFVSRWDSAFARAFPRRRDIEMSYKFILMPVGTIKKTLDIATRSEFLADEETAAKVRCIQASEAALKAEFYDFAAAAALNLRVGLLRALEPVVNGMHNGNSIGKKEVERIEKHMEQIKNFDLFGDSKVADMIGAVKKATDIVKAGIEGVEKARAMTKLSDALDDVKDGLTNLTFDPTSFRRLELDGDSDYAEVFADKEVCAEIRERMNSRLADALHELATKHGGSDDDKAAAEHRLRLAVGLKKLADDGANEATLDIAQRFMGIELDDAPVVEVVVEVEA